MELLKRIEAWERWDPPIGVQPGYPAPDAVTFAECAAEIKRLRTEAIELREAAHNYASLIQIENFDRNDMAVYRAYERLRKALETE